MRSVDKHTYGTLQLTESAAEPWSDGSFGRVQLWEWLLPWITTAREFTLSPHMAHSAPSPSFFSVINPFSLSLSLCGYVWVHSTKESNGLSRKLVFPRMSSPRWTGSNQEPGIIPCTVSAWKILIRPDWSKKYTPATPPPPPTSFQNQHPHNDPTNDG